LVPVDECGGKPHGARVRQKNDSIHCTIFGHGLVDGLHSIEKSHSYTCVFLIDGKNRRSRTGLFFDSFLSFSG
jgi:hypothetical protein